MITSRSIFAIVVVGLLFASATNARAQAPATQPALSSDGDGRVAVIVLASDIDDAAHRGLIKRFADARALGVDTVILQINTYGGLVHSGLEISRFLKQQDDLRIIAYVEDKAISAGAMIAVACDEIVMEPHAQIGDSGVIAMTPGGGLQQLGDVERAKIESPVIEDFRDSASENGYPTLLLEAMVNMARTVYWVENTETGERRFASEAEKDRLIDAGAFASSPWRLVEGVRNPIDDASSLLMLNSDLAVTLGLASEASPSVEMLAASRGWTIVGTLQPDVNEKVVTFLGSDIVRGILMTVFMFALYAALKLPGSGAPEVVAVVALGALLGVPALTGYAQWYEILAVLIGVVFLAVELFILPGFGIAGITGIVLILGGLTMTFVPPITLPNVPISQGIAIDWASVASGFYVVVGGLAASLLLWVWLSRYLPKLPYANRLILQTTAGGVPLSPDEAMTAEPEMPVVGEYGEALTDLRPGGVARFDGASRITDVVTDSGFVKAGTKLVVREVAGNRVVVRPVEARQTV